MESINSRSERVSHLDKEEGEQKVSRKAVQEMNGAKPDGSLTGYALNP